MGLRLNTNVPALVAQHRLRATRSNLDQTLEKLSSGSRINRASDDAAGLAVSEAMRAELRGLAQVERNVQDGISLVQVAEGALDQISQILIRLRELGVQAASDTLGSDERKFVDIEFQGLVEEIDRIANGTQYNQVPLLKGSSGIYEVQIGTRNQPEIDRIKLYDPMATDMSSVALGLNLANVAEKVNAQETLGAIDEALALVTQLRARFGGMQNRLQSATQSLGTHRENLALANSRVRDMDYGAETTALAKYQILMQSGISILSQANASNKAVLGLLSGGAG